ncbi:MAG: hypothetical protein H3C68_01495 [Deltaproteobacteria bacterium]|nr:hypothetical protein [Deltaproteobacteria bacterium]MBZ0219071.1 hypothetical protein [Deltaproteobacteria bacterium]
MAIFYKTAELAKEEARLAELKRLHDARQITTREYLDAINQLKAVGDGTTTGSQTASVLDVVQLGLIVALALAAVYALRMFKK